MTTLNSLTRLDLEKLQAKNRDLMVEVKSQECTLKSLREKIKGFLSLGTQVDILINPKNQTVEIYRLAKVDSSSLNKRSWSIMN